MHISVKPNGNVAGPPIITSMNDVVGFNSCSTHFRSFLGQFYRSDDPINSITAPKDNG